MVNSIVPVAPDGTERIALRGGGALVVRGKRGTPPILFLHGISGGAWSWTPQAVALAQSHRTYAWEARGHGETARVPDAGLGDYYEDACEALTYVTESEGRGPVIAAHSLGGLLALALTASRPADVAALFLVEPVYLSRSSSLLPLGTLELFGPAWPAFLLVLAEGFRYNALPALLYARSIFRFSFHDRAAMERAWVYQRRQRPIEYRRLLLEFAGVSTRFPLRQFAKEIARPVHLVEGSTIGPGMHFPHLINQLRPLGTSFTRSVIPGGHYLQLDRAGAVTADLRDFIATL